MVESEGTKCLKLGKRLQPQSDEHMYEVRSGLRFVKPYEHEFTSFTKRRWIGQMLFDIFSTEFKAFSSNYYSDAIKSGMITVNGKKVGLDYRLKDSDRIVHKTTRQETPVLSDLPAVVFESDDLIAVNKPCSIPVHPCGNFNYNSLTNIVEICLNYKGLKSVHRLDRQTSGIVFFAKNLQNADDFRRALIEDKVKKVYYAKVAGNFELACKNGETSCSDSIYCESHVEAIMTCCPIDEIPKQHLDKARDAYTKFKFKFYDQNADQSLVKCYPQTGRTHQIRVHLQKLGFPIANDQVYGGKVINDGDQRFDESLFANSYENEEQAGKKLFLILWLHAYKYVYKQLKVKTSLPKWAQQSN